MTTDDRLKIKDGVAYIKLKDTWHERGYDSFNISRLPTELHKYLYPRMPSAPDTMYIDDIYPVFRLGSEYYYFKVSLFGNPSIFMIDPPREDPASSSGLIFVDPDTLPDAISQDSGFIPEGLPDGFYDKYYSVEHYVFDMTTGAITVEHENGSKHEFISSMFGPEVEQYLKPERFVRFTSDGMPVFELNGLSYYFGTVTTDRGIEPAITYITTLEIQGDPLPDEIVDVQYAEYLPGRFPDVYDALVTALEDGDYSTKSSDAYFALVKSKLTARSIKMTVVPHRNRLAMYRAWLEFLFHHGVLSTSNDMTYDLTRSDMMSYPTWDPYENKPNYAATVPGMNPYIACRISSKPYRGDMDAEITRLTTGKILVNVQTDEVGFPITTINNPEWVYIRTDFPTPALRASTPAYIEDIYRWFYQRKFCYYVMGHVAYITGGSLDKFPISGCGDPEFMVYNHPLSLMPANEIVISVQKTTEWVNDYQYAVKDHEGVGLYPKLNTLQLLGYQFSNFDCTVGYTLDDLKDHFRVFPVLQLTDERSRVSGSYRYSLNDRFYRLNMYEDRVYMIRNPHGVSTEPGKIRSDYWLFATYKVEYQEQGHRMKPQMPRVARAPILTEPIGANDTVSLNYKDVQNLRREPFKYIAYEVAGVALAGILTALVVQYAPRGNNPDVKITLIASGVVVASGAILVILLNLSDIIRWIGGEVVDIVVDTGKAAIDIIA